MENEFIKKYIKILRENNDELKYFKLNEYSRPYYNKVLNIETENKKIKEYIENDFFYISRGVEDYLKDKGFVFGEHPISKKITGTLKVSEKRKIYFQFEWSGKLIFIDTSRDLYVILSENITEFIIDFLVDYSVNYTSDSTFNNLISYWYNDRKLFSIKKENVLSKLMEMSIDGIGIYPKK